MQPTAKGRPTWGQALPPMKKVKLTWDHAGMRFRGVGAGNVPITIDGDSAAGPGPMEALLLALAACSGSDVVSIVAKKRITLTAFEVDVEGDRREEHPRKYVAIRLTYRLAGEGLTAEAARQAIDLSLQKYCSVTHSLNPDIAISYEMVVES